MSKNSRLVYSTETGRIKESAEKDTAPKGDGYIRIRRETSGRKGKGVTVLAGFELESAALNALARELKQLCGTGGTVKNFTIEIQGEQREKLKAALIDRGYKVKG